MVNLSNYDQLIIWGANFSSREIPGTMNSGVASKELHALLQRNGYWDKVTFFVDSNKQFHGKTQYGREVKDPAAILQYPNALVIVATISIQAIRRAMEEMGASNDRLFIPYYWMHGTLERPYSKEFAKEHMKAHKQEILQLFQQDDAHTQRYLEIILSLREKCEDDLYTSDFYAHTGENLSYFCDPELAPKSDVTFIDVGAYTGDSIEPVRSLYGKRLKRCFAFEPDPDSRKRLLEYIAEKGLSESALVFPYALGEKNGATFFSQEDSSCKTSGDGALAIEQRAFDALPRIDVIGDSMVKMDIEGFELEALKGMQSFIKTYQPYLAICLYHQEADLYDIPKYIKELYPEYRLYLRGGWHLECWAVPERHFKAAD